MDTNELMRKLERYGADITGIDRRFYGDRELYKRLFYGMFADDSLSLLENAVEKKDYDKAFEYAHSLKGLTGNLGLTPLYKDICYLVEALRAKEYDNTNMQCDDVVYQMRLLEKMALE